MMNRKVLLLFGGLPYDYLHNWEITSNLRVVEEKLDVNFVEVKTQDLVERTYNLTNVEKEQAKQIANQIIINAVQTPQETHIDVEEVVKATELYVAMKTYLDKHNATATTIVCHPWIREPNYATPCIALMLLQEDGVPAACQGDIDALLTMVMFKRAADAMSCMGNNFEVSGELGVGHCVLSRNLCDPTTSTQPYYIADYHGRKSSPTIHTTISLGQVVTIARLTRNLENLILTQGRVIENLDLQDRCRNTLVIRVDDTTRVLRAMKGLQQHLVVACGNHIKEMTTQAQEAGINIINV
jgi:L-fucose isomerase-like protein